MKVLLVQSATGRPESPVFPLGLAFLAGQLREHEVRVLDLALSGGSTEPLVREAGSFQPDLIGISFRNVDDSAWPVTHSYLPPFTAAVESLSSWKGVLAAGGTAFSIYPEKILEMHPRVDFGLPGEGEVLLPLLLDHLSGTGSVPGWDGGRLLPRMNADLERTALPLYSLFDLEPYSAVHGIGVQSRRGCAFGCTYCTYGYLSGKSFRPRPVEHVLADIRNLESLGAGSFQFVDSVFNCPVEYFTALLEGMEEAGTGLRWAAWLDTEVTGEQLRRMAAAGADKVDFSPDAVTSRGLRLLGKRGDPRALYPLVREARKAGMQAGVNFFNGNPGEGFWALMLKFLFMARARFSLGMHDTFVSIGTIRAYAHSEIAQQMVETGMVSPACDFFEPVFYRRSGPADWLYRLFALLRKARH